MDVIGGWIAKNELLWRDIVVVACLVEEHNDGVFGEVNRTEIEMVENGNGRHSRTTNESHYQSIAFSYNVLKRYPGRVLNGHLNASERALKCGYDQVRNKLFDRHRPS